MRISDWSSDVCSSDLDFGVVRRAIFRAPSNDRRWREVGNAGVSGPHVVRILRANGFGRTLQHVVRFVDTHEVVVDYLAAISAVSGNAEFVPHERSEERRVGKECVITCRYRWSP